MYAIVDIETTGGYANMHRIIEIGVVLHNGKEVEETYETLINPERMIPLHIEALTGINQDMVESAPVFAEVADKIAALLENRIFIAHNVNFDYSFLKAEFENIDQTFRYKKMCSVRYLRKVFPGLPSYSLGKLATRFKVENPARHRALGDALTTVKLLEMAFEADDAGILEQQIKQNNRETILPVHLNKEEVESLPHRSGVYYFYNAEGKIIYIGKAKDLKKRVISHFTGDASSLRKQAFFKEITAIKYQETGMELLAALLEDHEIRQYWPRYNKAQKKRPKRVGVYVYEDRSDVKRIAIQPVHPSTKPLVEFNSHYQARSWVFEKAEAYGLKMSYSGLPYSDGEVTKEEHNTAVEQLMADVNQSPAFEVWLFNGKVNGVPIFIAFKAGKLAGMGNTTIKDKQPEALLEELKPLTTSYLTGSILSKLQPFVAEVFSWDQF